MIDLACDWIVFFYFLHTGISRISHFVGRFGNRCRCHAVVVLVVVVVGGPKVRRGADVATTVASVVLPGTRPRTVFGPKLSALVRIQQSVRQVSVRAQGRRSVVLQ